MATMAENVIAAGAENLPPMLEKGMYDRKSCDIKATNIILLGLPVDIYTLVNHHKTAKYIWDRIKELIEGIELTIQERESKLYDNFDRFTSEKGESIHSYYLRYAKLINDMNIINMKMTPIQINAKFVNHLQPEWSRFVTAAKQEKDLHKVNFNQLYAYLKQNENDANEVRVMRHRFPNPLALLVNTYNPPPSYSSQRSFYKPPVVQQQSPTPSTQLDSGFVIPSFLLTDDPIASLNKTMMFLSTTISSRFPPTNNQLRTSSNPRTQATIQDGKVTIQNVQGRQSRGYGVNTGKGKATGTWVINTVGDVKANQPRVIRCYNCKGEGHIAKKCTAKKMVKDSEWFKYKMLLAQAQEAGVILKKEQLDFLADGSEDLDSDCDDLQLYTTSIFKANHVDAFDSDCNEAPTTNILSEVPPYDTHHETDMLNPIVQKTEYSEHLVSNNDSYDELTSDNNVISYVDYMVTIENDAA
ncbi:reverse transcriptase domain-containing protein [Tanacetum coccineum]|uniref:Reverse transcriptase domain-containing protein n=1 Tax=Tanacetum coccineum TaxID=301880 RepID=A0ABQ4XM16_9ASTR